jgi:hypothetical protein
MERAFFEGLVSLHVGGASVAKRHLHQHLVGVAKLLLAFALQQRDFVALADDVQKSVMRKAAPAFAQYFLAK